MRFVGLAAGVMVVAGVLACGGGGGGGGGLMTPEELTKFNDNPASFKGRTGA